MSLLNYDIVKTSNFLENKKLLEERFKELVDKRLYSRITGVTNYIEGYYGGFEKGFENGIQYALEEGVPKQEDIEDTEEDTKEDTEEDTKEDTEESEDEESDCSCSECDTDGDTEESEDEESDCSCSECDTDDDDEEDDESYVCDDCLQKEEYNNLLDLSISQENTIKSLSTQNTMLRFYLVNKTLIYFLCAFFGFAFAELFVR